MRRFASPVAALLAALTLSAPGVALTAATSQHARLVPVDLPDVHWTQGFWADRFELCRREMVPGMGRLMEGTNHNYYFESFRIAAGLTDGRRQGAQFNDGDFYKWLEAAAAIAGTTRDPELNARLDEIISVIARAQRSDGYIHTPALIRSRQGGSGPEPFENPLRFEMYNLGHLLTAACRHYRSTGKTNFLSVARKAADFLDRKFPSGGNPVVAVICPSHYMGLIDLYRVTSEVRYLALAQRLFDGRDLGKNGGDDNQDRVPFRQQTNAVGHAVRANYLYAGAADLFSETGDPAIWASLEKIWTNVVRQKMHITGGCGALYDGASPDGSKDQSTISRVHQAYGRNYQLPNLTAHNETCANIGNVLWNWRMFLATGEARFMDVVELALYNSVLSGMSLNGTNFFYVNPLRQLGEMPSELRWPRQRVPYVSSFCCPPNLVRTIAEAGGYAYAKSDMSLCVNLYGGSIVTTTLADGQTVSLVQTTEYPWSGHVRLEVTASGLSPFSLKLRIPGWTRTAAVHVNHARANQPAIPGSYLELKRKWHRGDVVEIDFPMPVQLMEANPHVEETLHQAAVKRGPLVYCLESLDLPHGIRLTDVTVPARAKFAERQDKSLGAIVLESKVLAESTGDWSGRLYRELEPRPAKEIAVRWIPYFCWANRGPWEMSVWLPLSR